MSFLSRKKEGRRWLVSSTLKTRFRHQSARGAAGLLAFFLAAGVSFPVMAKEDYSDEEAWYEKCTKVQTTREGITACQGFQTYQNKKRDDLNASIDKFTSSITDLENSASDIEAKVQEQKELSAALQQEIDQREELVKTTQASIQTTTDAVAEMQEAIDIWDAQIKMRMRQEQSLTGTNSMVDLIMGSTSLADMLRKATGLARITASDQNQINEINARKEELRSTISGLETLIEQNKTQIEDLESEKKKAQEMQDDYEKLVKDYQNQIADLQAQKRTLEVDREAIHQFTISVDLTAAYFASIPKSDSFIDPVPAGRVSAGTWAYPGGGLHLGLDLAAPIGSDLVAPAAGLIIYASNEQPSNSGYLGNWSGNPQGSGNFIEMLCEVNGTTYAINFSHLSNEFYVEAGDIVQQGQVLAQTGNAGNSTGPHTHIEIYNLGKMTIKEAVEKFKKDMDFTFGAGWGSGHRACEAGNAAPCRERPENFLLKASQEEEKEEKEETQEKPQEEARKESQEE